MVAGDRKAVRSRKSPSELQETILRLRGQINF